MLPLLWLPLPGFGMPITGQRLPWFVKTETFKTSLTFPQIKPHLDEHKAWVAALRAEGRPVTSGYRVDAEGKPGGGGLMLFAAEDFAAAEHLVLCDPLIANDCVDWSLNEWIADVGDIALVDGGAWYAKGASVAKRSPPPTMCAATATPKPRVTLEPDYRLAAGVAGGAGLVALGVPFLGAIAGLPGLGLAAFLATRTSAVRFVFDPDALEVMAAKDGNVWPSGNNFAVGGRNRWEYEAITEWAMYPSPEAPVLVYFREVQTRPEGQGHLFPVLASPSRLREQLEERVGGERRITGPPRL